MNIKSAIFTMPYVAEVSINHSTGNRAGGGRYLKPVVKQWQGVLAQQVGRWIDENGILLKEDEVVTIDLIARFPKTGGRRPDGDNFLKHAQDAIADAFRMDDCTYRSRVREIRHNCEGQGGLHYVVSLNGTAPKDKDAHYLEKVDGPERTREATQYYLDLAHRTLFRELYEEIMEAEYNISSPTWRSMVHLRALELVDEEEEILPAIRLNIMQTIEREVLYHYVGYGSAEEWFVAEGSRLKRSGGQWYDYKFWRETLIPFTKAEGLFKDDQEADKWFLNTRNTARLRTPGVNTALRDAITGIENPEERKQVVSSILSHVEDDTPRRELKAKTQNLRGNKPTITIIKNGTGMYHVEAFDLTERQFRRFMDNNQFATVVNVEKK